jgi:putative spermidine/putrescine transport system substrate-binding protein
MRGKVVDGIGSLSFPMHGRSLMSRRATLQLAAGAFATNWFGQRVARAQGALPGTAQMPAVTSVSERLKGTGEVSVSSFGGVLDQQRKAFYEPFSELTGIKVVEAPATPNTKVRAMVDTKNVDVDVVSLTLGSVLELEANGDYFEKIDYDLIDPGVPNSYRNAIHLATASNSIIFAYRNDAFKERTPKDFKDFWDVKTFPGPRALPSALGGLFPELVGALLADGVPPDKIYPIDIERALRSLAKIKPNIEKWYQSINVPIQMLIDKEVVMAGVWSSTLPQDASSPIVPVWAGTIYNTGFAVPKGAPNRANAMKFLAFISQPVPQARMSVVGHFGYTNTKAADYIPANSLRYLPTAPENIKGLIPQDVRWWAANRGAVTNRWTTWVLE